MNIQKLKSSKLFYNKWPYKVECSIYGASRIVHIGIIAMRDWCEDNSSIEDKFWKDSKRINKGQLLKFINAVDPFVKNSEVQIRAEGAHFNLFCKDKELLSEINNKLATWIIKISGPTSLEEYNFLISNGHKKILCDRLPKDKFQYRIYFKSAWSADKRQLFLCWYKNFEDRLQLSPTSMRWMENKRKWTYDPFMYVTDSTTLSMVGLYLSGQVKKVEEFIPRNTVLTT